MPFAITSDGITIQTVDELNAEMKAQIQDSEDGFGPDFVWQQTEIVPVYTGIIAQQLAKIQAGIKALLDARKPGSARGVHADDIAALTGTERQDAVKSTVPVKLTGTAGATIPAGRVYQHNPTETLWDQTSGVTLDGSGFAYPTIVAQEPGPIDIVASTDWTIVVGDPDLSDVESVSNSTPGRLEESDEALEERRRSELGSLGAATKAAIQANLVQDNEGILDATVYVNFRDDYDADGIPPHSVECIVDRDGIITDDEVALAIWEQMPAGIRAYGSTIVTITDPQDSRAYEVGFSNRQLVTIYLRITVTTTGAEETIIDTAATADAIKAAVVEDADARHPIGRDVIPDSFIGPVFDTVPDGAAVAVQVEVSTDGSSYQPTVLSLDLRQRALFDEARVSVVYA